MSIVNRKASFEYEIVEKFTAGMVLQGAQVKSIRAGNVNIKGSWVIINEKNQLVIKNMYISPWEKSVQNEIEKMVEIPLLLNAQEIKKIRRIMCEKGYTLFPLSLKNTGKHLKCVVAVGRGRKKYEKREVLKNRSIEKSVRQKFAL